MNGPDLKIPDDYRSRESVHYFDDVAFLDGDVIHQPEVYDAADYLLKAGGRRTIIDIGCGNGRKLKKVGAERHIGIDFGPNIDFCRKYYGTWGEWHEQDLTQPDCVQWAELADHTALVVCADVVEHLLDPTPLLALLAACYQRGAQVLTSTPDRVRGRDHKGPPPNPSHIREWALDEYTALLKAVGLPSVFAGYTINNSQAREPKTIVTLHDRMMDELTKNRTEAKPSARPLAILAAYNEADIIRDTITDWLDQGCDVHCLDNWSTDKTGEILDKLHRVHGDRVTVERFPPDESVPHGEWKAILARKATIAASHPGRWIIHSDADELRRAPFPGMTIAQALDIARQSGANRVHFNLINFRPTDELPYQPGTLKRHFSFFEFGTLPGHFLQAKAWIQGEGAVDLVSSGGHIAKFQHAKDFVYRFLLKHYPIRSAAHGQKKVLHERVSRWSPEEMAKGWHRQYEVLAADPSFIWDPAFLFAYDSDFWADHGLAILTDLPERRSRQGLTVARGR
ncbi:MAG: glycosyltransferase family 2 protein [Rhizobiales bacterium]|nr:glycosyltransferase family 2 protein [Hyphomicrobiales bacterium]